MEHRLPGRGVPRKNGLATSVALVYIDLQRIRRRIVNARRERRQRNQRQHEQRTEEKTQHSNLPFERFR